MAGGSKIWTVRGIPAELQAAVSAAAKAGRQTLGEWTATALSNALGGGEAEGAAAPSSAQPLSAIAAHEDLHGRLSAAEARLAALERVIEGIGHRAEGTHFRFESLEQYAEGLDRRLATALSTLGGRLDALEAGGVRSPPMTPVPDSSEPPDRLFTRGVGGRKRLTAAGEEELQRLLAIGADDAAIAARLGIHKRIVWARRLTDNSAD